MTTPETQRVIDILEAASTALNSDEPKHLDHNTGVLEMTAVLLGMPMMDFAVPTQLTLIFNRKVRHPADPPQPKRPSFTRGEPLHYLGLEHMDQHGHRCTVFDGPFTQEGVDLVRVTFDDEVDRIWILPAKDLYVIHGEPKPWLTYPIGREVVCTSQPEREGEWGRVVDYVRDTRQHKVLFEDGTYLFLHDGDLREASEAEIIAGIGPR